MAKRKKNAKVQDYRHGEKRKNNPPIGIRQNLMKRTPMYIKRTFFYIQTPKDIPPTVITRKFLAFSAATNTGPAMFPMTSKKANKKLSIF